MLTTLRELAEAETKNFELSTGALGPSIGILNAFEKAYGSLPPLVSLPEGGLESDETMAVYAVLHELAFCRRQLTMSVLTLLRAYQGDAMLHLRRAIEACAFAVRMNKHHEVVRAWLSASDDDAAYERYRGAFRTKDLFPNANHPDHDPVLTELKSHYDQCSKLMHGSIFGMGGHFEYPDSSGVSFQVKFFDLAPDHSLIVVLYLILASHRQFLQLFGNMLRPYNGEAMDHWMTELKPVQLMLDVYREDWKRHIPNPVGVRNDAASL
ncbi:MAG TPA: hypothetical protein VGK29_22935 [Paludibaculum sp.]|jgi:hypothetical protein